MRILTESFDGFGGDQTQLQRVWTHTGANPLSTAHPKTGSYGLGGVSGITYTYAPGITPQGHTLIFGLWLYWTNQTLSGPGGSIIAFMSAATWNGFNTQFEVVVTTSGEVKLTRGGTQVAISASGVVANNAMSYIEGKVLVNNTAGTYDFKVNGSSVLSGTGVNTSASGANDTIAGVILGSNTTTYLDDLWVFDVSGATFNDFPSEKLLVSCHLPTGAGLYSEQTSSGGGVHAADADEAIGNDDTDYLSGTAGQRELFTFDFTSLIGHVRYAASVSALVKATSAGLNTFASLMSDGAGLMTDIPLSASTSYGYVRGTFNECRITLDAAVDGGNVNTGTTLTYSVTIGNVPNRLLLVCTAGDTTVDSLTGVTYAGVAMTMVGKIAPISASGRYLYFHYLLAPATGANNVVVSGSNKFYASCAASYYHVDQSAVNASATSFATGSGPSSYSDPTVTTLTPGTANSLVALAEQIYNSNVAPAVSGTATTRLSYGVAFGTQGLFASFPIPSTGATTLSVSHGTNGQTDVIGAWAPAIPSGSVTLANATQFGVKVDTTVAAIRTSQVFVEMLVGETYTAPPSVSSFERVLRGVSLGVLRGAR